MRGGTREFARTILIQPLTTWRATAESVVDKITRAMTVKFNVASLPSTDREPVTAIYLHYVVARKKKQLSATEFFAACKER